MVGVIAGDVIRSVHEHALTKSTDFPLFDPRCRFTDDTVLSIATLPLQFLAAVGASSLASRVA
jgi:hypothetical protein